MSEKQAKKARKEVMFQTVISVMNDGMINVHGFPEDLNAALNLMDGAKNTIIMHFIDMAKLKRLNNKNIIDGGNIIVPSIN